MRTFTFDTNCLIDLDENRDAARYIWQLIELHRKKELAVAFVSVSASERQKGDYFLPSYTDFLDRLKVVGVEDVPQIPGLAYFDISYWDQALWASEECEELERKIHEVLFPYMPFRLEEYATSLSTYADDLSNKQHFKWRNAWCDRQMIWSHIHHERHVFVTSDGNFKNIGNCTSFKDILVATPKEAVALL